MAEKMIKSPPGVMVLKPVPMKLFATWEVDRTPPNCIRRLCSLTLTRLMVVKALGSDIASITIAVKMQGSKRTLRSNEMALPTNGLLDTELQLNFSLQYPHFLKQEGNKLHIMLQRRKRYKNRTILGYKTLAEGVINMSQVLQREIDLELDLMSDMKEPKIHNNVMAKVTVQSMNSQPVDHEESTKTSQTTGRVTDFSDEDEEFSSNEDIEGSDSEPTLEERLTRKAKIPVNVRQRNLKQKFISLLKRFRVNEDLQGLETERRTIGRNISGADMDPADIEELFEELEEMSDSGPEVDTMSISSTPKPSLRPFFSSSRTHLNIPGRPYRGSLPAPAIPYQTTAEKTIERLSDESSKKADSDSHQENWTDSDPQPPAPAPLPAPASAPASSPPTCSDDKRENQDRERKSRLFARDRNSSISMSKISKKGEKTCGGVLNPCQISSESSIEPRKVLVEQLNRVLPSDDCVPEHLTLVNCGDPMGALLAAKLHDRQHKVISIINSADLRHTVLCLVNKIQKFCNSSPKPPAQIKVLLTGSDSFMNCVLRHYVEQLSCKPPDWQTYIRFLVVPIGSNCLCRYLGSLDEMYNTLFVADSWKELLEKGETNELVNRIHNYLLQSNATVHLPIAEAMLTYKEKSSDDESSQIFIPFMNDVRLGSSESSTTTSVDLDEMLPPLISGSPPSSLTIGNEKKVTPPSSPNIGQSRDLCEPLELQLDYWLLPGDTGVGGGEKKKSDYNKSTLKLSFRSLQVARLSPLGEQPTSHFIIYYSTKEKKQKIMRLGKKKEKEKEIEPRAQTVEGVSRLIVSPKAQNIPLKLCIDGTEWTGVKFFQLSAQWQTHIRHFPVSLFSAFEGTPS